MAENISNLVLSDASPLIALSRVNGLAWLTQLFGTVWLPQAVRDEVLSGQALPGEAEMAAAISAGWLRVHPATPATPDLPDLDEGEAACIRIALSEPGPVLLLMDERAGRAVATELGLQVTGTAAVIGMAKARGLIPSAREVFARLHAAGFRVAAAVISEVLRRVGEA
jgi:predicted nucleic acid-binding protein